jgi:hypothetical protein
LEGKKPDGRLIFFMIRDNFAMLNLGGGITNYEIKKEIVKLDRQDFT